MRGARLMGAFAMAAILVASVNAFADTTPPVITPNVSGTLGGDGWYTSDVTVSWTVTDDESPVLFSSGCGTTVITADTSGSSFTCSATSAGGTSSATQSVKRDTTGPVVSFTGNAGVYSVEQTVEIFCNASDPLSGVASSTCGAPVTGLAYTFPLETPITQFVTATDNAGNTSVATLVFTVDVTYDGVAALADQFSTKRSLDRNVTRTLASAEDADNAGAVLRAERKVDRFIAVVQRSSGRHLDPADADLLVMLAGYL